MDCIYSRPTLLKIKELEQCKFIVKEIKVIDSTIIVEKQPPPFIENHNRRHNNRRHNNNRRRINIPLKPTKPLVRAENAWIRDDKPPTDIKRIKGILNKLSAENKNSMVKETKSIEYSDPEVVSIIFAVALGQPFFSEVYAQFCLGLNDLHQLIKEMCLDEFDKNRHKNLCRFIGELYKLRLIEDLGSFVELLTDDLCGENLEILCELVNVVGAQDPQFEEIVNHLYSIKNDYSARYKFMIMDVYDYKIGKRKPKLKKAEIKK